MALIFDACDEDQRGFFFSKQRKKHVMANAWINKIRKSSEYKNIQLLVGMWKITWHFSVKINNNIKYFLWMIHNHIVHYDYASCNFDMVIKYEYEPYGWKKLLYHDLDSGLNGLFETISHDHIYDFKKPYTQNPFEWLELSADNVNITAAIFLGILYQDRRNTVCKDKRKGQMYLRKGESLLKRRAEQGSKICKDILLTYPN